MNTQQKALHVLLDKETKDLNFDDHLQENVLKACEVLNISESQIEHLLPDLKYNEECFNSIRYKFITLCVHLLLTSEDDSEIQSVLHMIDIKKSFQFIISLGILPSLLRGIGLDISKRVQNADKFPQENLEMDVKYYRLSSITKVLLKCLEIGKLRNYILENHFSDILGALLQLSAAPLKQPNESTIKFYTEVMDERKVFRTDLHNLILNTHQPLVFRELMFLYGNKTCPNWLRGYILNILMERLEAKQGVESFIRAMVDLKSNDIGLEWKSWFITTKILMTKPKYANENDYYKNICGQLIKLLSKKSFDGTRIKHFEKAVVFCAKYLYDDKKDLCNTFFLEPLMAPFLKYTKQDIETERLLPSEVIERNINILYQIVIDKPVSSLPLKPIVLVLFNIYINCKKLNRLKWDIPEILGRFLEESNMKDDFFTYFLFEENPKDLLDVHKDYKFVLISDEIQFIKKTGEYDLFERANDCVVLLESMKNDSVVVAFMVYLLNSFIKLYQSNNIELIEKKVVVAFLLTKLLENKAVRKSITKTPGDVLIFCENLLKVFMNKSVHTNTDYDTEDYQIFFTTLMITNIIGKDSSIKSEFTILYHILEKISDETVNNEVKSLINEIITIEHVEKEKTEYDQAIDEVCSTLIPEQAHGMATLIKLIQQKDEKTLQKKQYVLNIFQQHLKSDESFLYLRAIAGLAAIASEFPGTVLETLIDEYENPNGVTQKDVETRMKLGEVLLRTTSNIGNRVWKYKPMLLNCFFTVVRDADPIIRASALSNLGQLCQVLGYKLGGMIDEILNCIYDIILNELAVEVRRAAVTVIRQLFIGLGKDMLAVLKEEILPIYRQLKKTYYNDPDDVTRLQAQLALEELNSIMEELLAPEIKLEKAFVTK